MSPCKQALYCSCIFRCNKYQTEVIVNCYMCLIFHEFYVHWLRRVNACWSPVRYHNTYYHDIHTSFTIPEWNTSLKVTRKLNSYPVLFIICTQVFYMLLNCNMSQSRVKWYLITWSTIDLQPRILSLPQITRSINLFNALWNTVCMGH